MDGDYQYKSNQSPIHVWAKCRDTYAVSAICRYTCIVLDGKGFLALPLIGQRLIAPTRPTIWGKNEPCFPAVTFFFGGFRNMWMINRPSNVLWIRKLVLYSIGRYCLRQRKQSQRPLRAWFRHPNTGGFAPAKSSHHRCYHGCCCRSCCCCCCCPVLLLLPCEGEAISYTSAIARTVGTACEGVYIGVSDG